MSEPWPIPVATALISVAGALVTIVFSRRAVTSDRRETAAQLATRFTEPLLQASFNLETRIYNIVELGFFARFHNSDSAAEDREYAVLNTLYVVAQYFCWLEILRRAAQFTDPRNDRRNVPAVHALEVVRDTFADSRSIAEDCFRLFRGEQRALGEVMLVPATAPEPGAPRWECLGYAPFVNALDDPSFSRWFGRLRSHIDLLISEPTSRDMRLRLIQRSLMDLIDALDPDSRRVPPPMRMRLGPPSSTATSAVGSASPSRRETLRDA